jgi:hypothetical protein
VAVVVVVETGNDDVLYDVPYNRPKISYLYNAATPYPSHFNLPPCHISQ